MPGNLSVTVIDRGVALEKDRKIIHLFSLYWWKVGRK